MWRDLKQVQDDGTPIGGVLVNLAHVIYVKKTAKGPTLIQFIHTDEYLFVSNTVEDVRNMVRGLA